MLRFAIICFGIFMIVRAQLTPEERQAMFDYSRPVVEKCMKEFNMNSEDAKVQDIAELDPCFIACCFKGNKILNEKGMFDAEESCKLVSTFASEESKQKIKERGEICLAVNDKEVSDGDKGCERATMIIECFKEVGSKQ